MHEVHQGLCHVRLRYVEASKISNGVLFLCGVNRMPFLFPLDPNVARFRLFNTIPFVQDV